MKRILLSKKQQLSNAALESDLYPKAVKLGMLGSICIMKEVSETLSCGHAAKVAATVNLEVLT